MPLLKSFIKSFNWLVSLSILSLLLSHTAHAEESHDLEKAFYKEYTFLLKEKKSLEQRLAEMKAENRQAKQEIEKEIETIKQSAHEKDLEAQRINEHILTIEKETLAKETNQTVFEATIDQANVTLHPGGDQKESSIQGVVDKSLALLNKNTGVRTVDGEFYLQDGSEVSGQIIHLGGVARFGLSDQGSGPLAPAGGGAFKLWQKSNQASKLDELSKGTFPDSLSLFIFDSPTKEVKSVEDKDVLTIINSGGVVAWIIVGLGALAVLLAILKTLFLISLGRGSKKTIRHIAEACAKSDLENAKKLAENCKGSAKRVVKSTLDNITREREHVEDAISEAILHEHTSLDRFQAQIMVIAAISPLLGLLGTVTGMIETFDIITEFGTGDPKLLSGGISIALVTTELGLIVAIPVLVIGSLLGVWSNKIKDELEKSALHIVNQFKNYQNP